MTPDNQKTTLPLVPAGIVRRDENSGPVLVGGYCPDCERKFFPRPPYCPQCLRPSQERILSGDGVIYSYTIVRTKPPFGLPQPYAVGFVDLTASGLRVFGLLDPGCIDSLEMGATVALAVGQVGHDVKGEPGLRPFFTLASTTTKGQGHD